MKYNHLGRTDIAVSEICLGTMTWGSQNTEAEAHEQMDDAVEKGVNFVDTAELYPTTPLSVETQGRTEEYIGSWFAKTGRRRDIVLATKVAGKGRDYLRNGQGADAANIRAAVDASLKRLKTDYIDLYQVHWPNRGHFHFRQSWHYNPFTQDREKAIANITDILEIMGELVKAGKVRAVGLSNETTWGIQKYLSIAEKTGRASPRRRTNTTCFIVTSISIWRNCRTTRMSGCSPIRRLPAAFSAANMSAVNGRWVRAGRSITISAVACSRCRSLRSGPISRLPHGTGSIPRPWRSPTA
jgi:aryl-alcohol dehydrogenase-like predicted oxidoreductase